MLSFVLSSVIQMLKSTRILCEKYFDTETIKFHDAKRKTFTLDIIKLELNAKLVGIFMR